MEHGGMDGWDERSLKRRSENFVELFRDPALGSHRGFRFRQNVKSKLAPEDLVLHLLEIQKINSLFLKFIHAGVAAFGGRLEDGSGSGLHCEFVMQIR